jgi:hypothetical protein
MCSATDRPLDRSRRHGNVTSSDPMPRKLEHLMHGLLLNCLAMFATTS